MQWVQFWSLVRELRSHMLPSAVKKKKSPQALKSDVSNVCVPSVQSLTRVQLFATPWTAACQVSLSITNSQSLLKLMSIESVMPSNYLILYFPLFLLPSIIPSIRVFSKWVSFSYQVAKVLELQHQSFQWIFRTDFLQNGLVGSPCSPRDSQESSPTSQFKGTNFLAFSFLYHPTVTSIMTTGKTIALTRWTFVGKVISF